MTMQISRDVACTSGHEAAYALYTALVAHGWTAVAWSDGTAGTRTAGAGPASAANLSAASAWFVVQHAATGRKFSYKRDASTATSCQFQYTDGAVSLSAGNASTPDNHATYTKAFFASGQWYPVSGTTTTKAHLVVDDASASFVMLLRRTPYAGGDCCTYVGMETVTPLTWAANPDPHVVFARYSDANTVGTGPHTVNAGNTAWYKRGISGEAWWLGQWYLENPGGVAGGAADPSGTDTEYEARWIYPGGFVLGKSALFRLLQPYRAPTTGMDGATNFARAAFGPVTVPNDGVALGS